MALVTLVRRLPRSPSCCDPSRGSTSDTGAAFVRPPPTSRPPRGRRRTENRQGDWLSSQYLFLRLRSGGRWLQPWVRNGRRHSLESGCREYGRARHPRAGMAVAPARPDPCAGGAMAATVPPTPFRCDVQPDRDRVIVRLAGELDLSHDVHAHGAARARGRSSAGAARLRAHRHRVAVRLRGSPVRAVSAIAQLHPERATARPRCSRPVALTRLEAAFRAGGRRVEPGRLHFRFSRAARRPRRSPRRA